MKSLMSFVILLIAFSRTFDAFYLALGTRLPGDKLLYSFYLESGPHAEARDIMLTFDYRVDYLIMSREFLTVINFTRPDDDLMPNFFGSVELNSTHLFMTPVRRNVTSWWLQGDLYGFDEEPFPAN
ncbi:hypothetical protein RP20_CCG026451 [Aedes albopictus]|nr:uncharacterized protein LOC115263750 [Aedes albopictus]KXJ80128.1 hypothetical protein RP20_CCG026451 [Aedes albopictus]